MRPQRFQIELSQRGLAAPSLCSADLPIQPRRGSEAHQRSIVAALAWAALLQFVWGGCGGWRGRPL